jgi:hypothetical protein
MDHDEWHQREAPTREELLEFAAGLPPDEAEALLWARPALWSPNWKQPVPLE